MYLFILFFFFLFLFCLIASGYFPVIYVNYSHVVCQMPAKHHVLNMALTGLHTNFSFKIPWWFSGCDHEIIYTSSTDENQLCSLPISSIRNCILISLRKHAYSNILKTLQPKKGNFPIKNSDIFHISAQNIDCGYSLEPPR